MTMQTYEVDIPIADELPIKRTLKSQSKKEGASAESKLEVPGVESGMFGHH